MSRSFPARRSMTFKRWCCTNRGKKNISPVWTCQISKCNEKQSNTIVEIRHPLAIKKSQWTLAVGTGHRRHCTGVQPGERLLTNWYRILLHTFTTPCPLSPDGHRLFWWAEQLRDRHSTGGKERYCFANRNTEGKCEACCQVLRRNSRFTFGGKTGERGNGVISVSSSMGSMNQQTSVFLLVLVTVKTIFSKYLFQLSS